MSHVTRQDGDGQALGTVTARAAAPISYLQPESIVSCDSSDVAVTQTQALLSG